MFNTKVEIDNKRDWKTYYPPELVGEYLKQFRDKYVPGQVIQVQPGMVVVPPSPPSLEDFLIWCAEKDSHAN